jgi:hypothetical protein
LSSLRDAVHAHPGAGAGAGAGASTGPGTSALGKPRTGTGNLFPNMAVSSSADAGASDAGPGLAERLQRLRDRAAFADAVESGAVRLYSAPPVVLARGHSVLDTMAAQRAPQPAAAAAAAAQAPAHARSQPQAQGARGGVPSVLPNISYRRNNE